MFLLFNCVFFSFLLSAPQLLQQVASAEKGDGRVEFEVERAHEEGIIREGSAGEGEGEER